MTNTANLSRFRIEYPAARGEVVQQGHADACAAFGHASYVIDGYQQDTCPRCGVLRGWASVFVETARR